MKAFFVRLAGVCCVGLGMVCGQSLSAQPASPAEVEKAVAQIRETSEKIRKVLQDPALAGQEHAEERFSRVRAALNERFDWPAISRWVLGRNLRKFDDENFREFTDLFNRYVVLYYMAKVEDYIGGGDTGAVDKVKILYGKGITRRDGAVVAHVTFKLPDRQEIDTVYTLVKDKTSGEWKVRNFVVEGVSLVSNWRTELNYIGRRNRILELLRKKVAGLEEQRQQAAAGNKEKEK